MCARVARISMYHFVYTCILKAHGSACVPFSTSSRHSRGQESPAQVWTLLWLRGSHSASMSSFHKCSHSQTSHCTCEQCEPHVRHSNQALLEPAHCTCMSVYFCLTSLRPWQQAQRPAVHWCNPLLTSRSPVSSDTAWGTHCYTLHSSRFSEKLTRM